MRRQYKVFDECITLTASIDVIGLKFLAAFYNSLNNLHCTSSRKSPELNVASNSVSVLDDETTSLWAKKSLA